jgi:putative hemolysin
MAKALRFRVGRRSGDSPNDLYITIVAIASAADRSALRLGAEPVQRQDVYHSRISDRDRRMRAAMCLLAMPFLLVACQQPSTASNPPPGVSYRLNGTDLGETNPRAERYCQQYGRQAVLESVGKSGSDNIAIYECR